MNTSRSKYEAEILAYLNSKYDDEFTIEKISRILTIGSNDMIYASCCSKKFPNDLFEVAIKLSVYDKYGKDEIVDILKQADVYNGELDEKEPVENTISDTYINIILQNEFDKKLSKIDATFVKTQITTPNGYLDVSDPNINLDLFFDEYASDVVVYTSIFINDEKALKNSNFLENIAKLLVCDKLKNQIIFYYVTDLESQQIADLYLQNYEENNEYFYSAPSTQKYIVEKYTNGQIG